MPHTPMTRREGSLLVTMIIIGLVVQLSVIGYVGYSSYKGRTDLVASQRRGCERGKLDRKDNADFQEAHKKYIDKVVLAKSVRSDIKQAAREAVQTYNKTAVDLTRRSKVNCSKAFPKGGILP